ALAGPDDAVILDGTSQMPLYGYYASRPWPTYPLPRSLPLDSAATAQELSQVATRHSGAWIFLYATPDYDPGYFVPTWLTAHAYPAFDDWAVSGRLQYYRFAPDGALTGRSTALTFGTSLTLDRYAYLPSDVAAGEAIPIDLRWTRLATELPHARVGLRLVDDVGVTWAQNDQTLGGDFPPAGGGLAGRPLADHHGVIVP